MKVYILFEGEYSDRGIVKCSLDSDKLLDRMEDIIKEDFNEWGHHQETDRIQLDASGQWGEDVKVPVSFEEFRNDQMKYRYNIEEYDLVV